MWVADVNVVCDYTNKKRLVNELPEELAKQSLFWKDKENGRQWATAYAGCTKTTWPKLCSASTRARGSTWRNDFGTLATKYLGFTEDITKCPTHHRGDEMVHQ